MKKVMLMLALALGVISANAQDSTGDYFEGLTRKITYDRMIPPYGIEVTYDKTVCAHKGE